MQEQFVVILTTTFSLLTAWSWNSFLQDYVGKYYGDSTKVKLIVAVVVTIITLLAINWILRSFSLKEKHLRKAKRTHMPYYVRERVRARRL